MLLLKITKKLLKKFIIYVNIKTNFCRGIKNSRALVTATGNCRGQKNQSNWYMESWDSHPRAHGIIGAVQ